MLDSYIAKYGPVDGPRVYSAAQSARAKAPRGPRSKPVLDSYIAKYGPVGGPKVLSLSRQLGGSRRSKK